MPILIFIVLAAAAFAAGELLTAPARKRRRVLSRTRPAARALRGLAPRGDRGRPARRARPPGRQRRRRPQLRSRACPTDGAAAGTPRGRARTRAERGSDGREPAGGAPAP